MRKLLMLKRQMKRKQNKKSNLAEILITPREKRKNKRQGENVLNEENDQYTVTPRGLLFCMINDLCPNCGKFDSEWFGNFLNAEKALVKSLSLLSSNGKDSDLFGESLNDLFAICVQCINTAAKYRKALEDLGENPDDIASSPFNEE